MGMRRYVDSGEGKTETKTRVRNEISKNTVISHRDGQVVENFGEECSTARKDIPYRSCHDASLAEAW